MQSPHSISINGDCYIQMEREMSYTYVTVGLIVHKTFTAVTRGDGLTDYSGDFTINIPDTQCP